MCASDAATSDALRRSINDKSEHGAEDDFQDPVLLPNQSYELDLRRHGLVVPAIEDELSELLDQLSRQAPSDHTRAIKAQLRNVNPVPVPGYENPLELLNSAVKLPALVSETGLLKPLAGDPNLGLAAAPPGSPSREASGHAEGGARDSTLTAPPSLIRLTDHDCSAHSRRTSDASAASVPAVAVFRPVDTSGVAKPLCRSVRLAREQIHVGTAKGVPQRLCPSSSGNHRRWDEAAVHTEAAVGCPGAARQAGVAQELAVQGRSRGAPGDP